MPLVIAIKMALEMQLENAIGNYCWKLPLKNASGKCHCKLPPGIAIGK
jgi:hypothetical protein